MIIIIIIVITGLVLHGILCTCPAPTVTRTCDGGSTEVMLATVEAVITRTVIDDRIQSTTVVGLVVVVAVVEW